MNHNLPPATEKETTLVVKMQLITINFNFEWFLWHSSEPGQKEEGVKYVYSKCVEQRQNFPKFI